MDPERGASSQAVIPPDALLPLASQESQIQAARMAQDAFSSTFRLTLNEDDTGRARGVAQLADALRNWCSASPDDDARSLRLAMVMLGLDQWGVAYSRAFGLRAIPGLTELVGALRTALDAREDARFQRHFELIDAAEGNAIDFKIELRRGIHLALWHAMIASDEREQATAILTQLGGMMFALVRLMPELGWRLVADAVANIQIHCLSDSLATEGLAQETTQALFNALSRELPAPERDLIMAHAARSVIAWQQSSRPPSEPLH